MKYKVGDKVKVKEWDDLVAEFGTYKSGDVNSKVVFCWEMKKYCGKVVTISGITEQGNYEIAEDKDALKWIFSEDVLLPVEKDTSWEKIKKGIMQASKALATIIKNVAKSTEWRVVDRPAKAGDYIRITKINPALDYGIEKVGDIVKVTKARENGEIVYVLGKDFPQDREKPNDYEADYEYAFLAREFEVVELAIKQQAEPEEEKPKFEVGKYYKCTNKDFGKNGGIIKITKHENNGFDYIIVEGMEKDDGEIVDFDIRYIKTKR